MGERHTRRQFVRRGSAAARAALAAASTPALLTASGLAAATTAELRRRLRGTLVTPRDPVQSAARALWNPRLDVAPRAIAFCETTADVTQVVRFARARGRPVAGRGRRHSFAGYSNVPGGIVATSRASTASGSSATGRSRGSAAGRTCSTSTATSSSPTAARCRSAPARRSGSPA